MLVVLVVVLRDHAARIASSASLSLPRHSSLYPPSHPVHRLCASTSSPHIGAHPTHPHLPTHAQKADAHPPSLFSSLPLPTQRRPERIDESWLLEYSEGSCNEIYLCSLSPGFIGWKVCRKGHRQGSSQATAKQQPSSSQATAKAAAKPPPSSSQAASTHSTHSPILPPLSLSLSLSATHIQVSDVALHLFTTFNATLLALEGDAGSMRLLPLPQGATVDSTHHHSSHHLLLASLHALSARFSRYSPPFFLLSTGTHAVGHIITQSAFIAADITHAAETAEGSTSVSSRCKRASVVRWQHGVRRLSAAGKTVMGKTRLANNNNNNPAADTTSTTSSSVAASPATIELSFPDGPQQPQPQPKQKTALPLSKFGAVAQAAFAAAASPDTTTPPAASAPQPASSSSTTPPPPPPLSPKTRLRIASELQSLALEFASTTDPTACTQVELIERVEAAVCGGTAGTSGGSRGSGGGGGGGTHVPIHRLSSIGKLTPAAAAGGGSGGGGGTAAGEYSLEDGLFARLACPYTTPNWQPPPTGHILLCGGVVPMGICARCLVEHWPHVSITALCAIPARGAASLPAWLEKAGTLLSCPPSRLTIVRGSDLSYEDLAFAGAATASSVLLFSPAVDTRERQTADVATVLTAMRVQRIAPNTFSCVDLHEVAHARFFRLAPRGLFNSPPSSPLLRSAEATTTTATAPAIAAAPPPPSPPPPSSLPDGTVGEVTERGGGGGLSDAAKQVTREMSKHAHKLSKHSEKLRRYT